MIPGLREDLQPTILDKISSLGWTFPFKWGFKDNFDGEIYWDRDIDWMLEIINSDRSDEWTAYDRNEVFGAWFDWIEDQDYKILHPHDAITFTKPGIPEITVWSCRIETPDGDTVGWCRAKEINGRMCEHRYFKTLMNAINNENWITQGRTYEKAKRIEEQRSSQREREESNRTE
jgi:hypothetical protein